MVTPAGLNIPGHHARLFNVESQTYLIENLPNTFATLFLFKEPQMRRIYLEDNIYFVTTVIYRRLPVFSIQSNVIALIDSLNYYRYKQKYNLLGYVIMPDHIHLIIWLRGGSNISEIMRDLKKFTAVRIIRQLEVEERYAWLRVIKESGKKTGRGMHKLWQDSYWDKIIYSRKMLREKLEYIHNNPIRAGLVQDVSVYPYSSYRNYEDGDHSLILIDIDWH